ncbi:MAG: hypothetical protein H6658_04725 [Ardenticatenaceae bacterium]|nr:hypothetical protein [Ardenticatenaceae bacterium]
MPFSTSKPTRADGTPPPSLHPTTKPPAPPTRREDEQLAAYMRVLHELGVVLQLPRRPSRLAHFSIMNRNWVVQRRLRHHHH